MKTLLLRLQQKENFITEQIFTHPNKYYKTLTQLSLSTKKKKKKNRIKIVSDSKYGQKKEQT